MLNAIVLLTLVVALVIGMRYYASHELKPRVQGPGEKAPSFSEFKDLIAGPLRPAWANTRDINGDFCDSKDIGMGGTPGVCLADGIWHASKPNTPGAPAATATVAAAAMHADAQAAAAKAAAAMHADAQAAAAKAAAKAAKLAEAEHARLVAAQGERNLAVQNCWNTVEGQSRVKRGGHTSGTCGGARNSTFSYFTGQGHSVPDAQLQSMLDPASNCMPRGAGCNRDVLNKLANVKY